MQGLLGHAMLLYISRPLVAPAAPLGRDWHLGGVVSVSLGLGAVRQVSRLISLPMKYYDHGAPGLYDLIHIYVDKVGNRLNRPPGSRDFARNQPVEPARKYMPL
jgi:hypothetical protein